VREVEGVGEHGLVDHLVVVGVAHVAVGRDRVRRRALEREARLEERAVEVVHALPGA
jgi:hypothetical protein